MMLSKCICRFEVRKQPHCTESKSIRVLFSEEHSKKVSHVRALPKEPDPHTLVPVHVTLLVALHCSLLESTLLQLEKRFLSLP